MKNNINEGTCKYCGSENLDFGTYEMADSNLLMYKYTCKDCKEPDNDWYSLTYEGKDE